jgi:hypothetical protein
VLVASAWLKGAFRNTDSLAADANTAQVTIEGLGEETDKSALLFRICGVERGAVATQGH